MHTRWAFRGCSLRPPRSARSTARRSLAPPEIAEDPHRFILRQGWASLDFTDEIELAQLRRLHPAPAGLQLEIVAVIESLNRLRESPDYELCQISEQKPGVLEELAAERAALLEKESAELEGQASRLAEEIKELGGEESQIS